MPSFDDPYPGKVMLTISDVRSLFGLTDPDEFDKFVGEQPLFPRTVRVGKTASGAPRLRYVKWKVYAFLDLWAAAGSDYGDATPDQGATSDDEEESPPKKRTGKVPKLPENGG